MDTNPELNDDEYKICFNLNLRSPYFCIHIRKYLYYSHAQSILWKNNDFLIIIEITIQ